MRNPLMVLMCWLRGHRDVPTVEGWWCSRCDGLVENTLPEDNPLS